MSARIAYWWWRRTRRVPSSEKESALKARSERTSIIFENTRIQLYRWGKPPYILLVPGWNGRAGQFRNIVENLEHSGYGLLACEPPGHGESDGSATSILQIARLVTQLVETQSEITGFIGHSAGAIGGFIGLLNAGKNIEKAVFIGMPVDTRQMLETYCQQLNLRPATRQFLTERFLAQHGIDAFERSSPIVLARQYARPWLIIHDKQDRIVNPGQAVELHNRLSLSVYYESNGFGHFRTLHAAPVLSRICDYFNEISPKKTES